MITRETLHEACRVFPHVACDYCKTASHARETFVGIVGAAVITAPWIDPTERVAWLNWTHRAWGVETPVSGDALAQTDDHAKFFPMDSDKDYLGVCRA